MTEPILEVLGIGAFIFIVLTIFYYVAEFLGMVKITRFLGKFIRLVEVIALSLGFIHGYYMADKSGDALSGYFAWLILALLIFSTLFFTPKNNSAAWKGYITALVIMLLLFACMPVYSVSVGFPVFEIVDPLLTA